MAATLRQLGFKIQFVYGNLDWALAEAKLISGIRIAFALRYVRDHFQASEGLEIVSNGSANFYSLNIMVSDFRLGLSEPA